ncbi:hypothetical protein QM012_001897 [Aureobasidium pullulans]|uniref:Required for respiratory growth protein 7, mitochondrial n=1 Tax=Aureobasidium pullulans TaxID=5580 RepID=A0ABR0TDC8_AURPU
MHFRHALITFTRLNRPSVHLPILRYLSQNVKPSLVGPADLHDGPSTSSTLDDTTPLKKTRSRRTNSDYISISEKTESSPSPTECTAEPPRRRSRSKKTTDSEPATPEEVTSAPPKKRTRKPKTPKGDGHVITHGSLHHTSLSEFLTYADAANLSPTSTVYRGTHYEYTVAEALERLAFSLTRVGRASDLGIDLLGSWALPSHPKPLNVLIQCKAEAPKPSMVRELEGAVVGAPVRYRGEGTVAILAAAKEATKGVRDAVGRSGLPMAYLNITTEGKIRQFVWNHAAVECGLEGVGVALRYLADGDSEVTLTWKGVPWYPSSPSSRSVVT